MNFEKKKSLAVRTFNVGRDRIIFNSQRLDEIKEAITKQDMRDLLESGAISIRDIKGRKAVVRRKTRRRAGSVRKKSRNTKTEYVILTRKLRNYISELRSQKKLSDENFYQLRKEIRAHSFKSKAHIKERLKQI